MEQKKARLIGGAILALAVVVLFGITYAAFSQTLRINGSATAVSTTWDIHFANLGPTSSGDVTGQITGTAKQLTAPAIKTVTGGSTALTGTAIETYSVSLTSPGDKISYIFDVVNAGDYNAVISSVGNTSQNNNVSDPTCVGTGDNAATDASNVCASLTYTLHYYDRTNQTIGDAVAPTDTLNAGETKTMILTLQYVDFTTGLDTAISGVDTALATQYAAIDADENITDKAAAKEALRIQTIQGYQSTYANKLPKAAVTISNLGFTINYVQDGNATIYNNNNQGS